MTDYHHTQPGTLIRRVLAGLLIPFLALPGWMIVAGESVTAAAVSSLGAVAILVCLLLFHSLTVDVSATEIRLAFGPGLLRKCFSLANVNAVHAVQTRWWNGWGIHKISGGWLYNVSGDDAVELTMNDGSRHQIGTDDPDRLVAAIGHAMQTR